MLKGITKQDNSYTQKNHIFFFKKIEALALSLVLISFLPTKITIKISKY